MSLRRYRVVWAGGPGGTGVSTFYSDELAAPALADIRQFFVDCAAQFPSTLSWSFPNTGDTIDLATGQIDGAWTEASAAPVAGTATLSAYAAGVGARVVWQTGVVINGRRVKGSTFLTSLRTGVFESDGTITAAPLALLQAAATTLASTGLLVIYSRLPSGGGSAAPVLSGNVPDKVSWLRSRRE